MGLQFLTQVRLRRLHLKMMFRSILPLAILISTATATCTFDDVRAAIHELMDLAQCDSNGDNEIEMFEAYDCAKNYGAPEEVVGIIFHELDINGDQKIDQQEADQHIANALEFIGNNCDHDDNGGISWNEAADCFTSVFGNNIHDDIVEYAQQLFALVDHDGDGEITAEEAEYAIQYILEGNLQ